MDKDLKAALADMQGQNCIGCGRPAEVAGVVDIDPELFQGQERLIYPACLVCIEHINPEKVQELAAMEQNKNVTAQ